MTLPNLSSNKFQSHPNNSQNNQLTSNKIRNKSLGHPNQHEPNNIAQNQPL